MTTGWSSVLLTKEDGQQRTISLAQYVDGQFPIKVNGNDKFFINLSDGLKERVRNYELTIYVKRKPALIRHSSSKRRWRNI